MFTKISFPKSVSRDCARADCSPVPFSEGQLREIFKRFDTNRDGRLSKKELENAFNSLDSRFPGWRAKQALLHADENGDGYISMNEYDKLVKYALKCNYKSIK